MSGKTQSLSIATTTIVVLSMAYICSGVNFWLQLFPHLYGSKRSTCVTFNMVLTCNHTFSASLELTMNTSTSPEKVLAEISYDSGGLLEYNHTWDNCFGRYVIDVDDKYPHFYLNLVEQSCTPLKSKFYYFRELYLQEKGWRRTYTFFLDLVKDFANLS